MFRSSLIAVSCLLANAVVISQPQVIPDSHEVVINPIDDVAIDIAAEEAAPVSSSESQGLELTRNHLQLDGSGEIDSNESASAVERGELTRRADPYSYLDNDQHRENMAKLCMQHKYKVTAWLACWLGVSAYAFSR